MLPILLGAGPGIGHAADAGTLQFAPPQSARARRQAFWEIIYRLERTHASFGSRETELVQEFKNDLKPLSQKDQDAFMVRFLGISHHYRGLVADDIPAENRQFHNARFVRAIKEFADFAKGNSLQTHLFVHIRSLAEAGPPGLKLSRRLARVSPENAGVHGNLAQDLLDAGEFRDALSSGQRATSLDSQEFAAFTTMASAQYALKEYAGAFKAAEAALRINPGDKVAYSVFLMAKPHLPGGARAPRPPSMSSGVLGTRRSISKVPTAQVRSSNRYAEESRLAHKRGDFERAVELASRAYEQNPENAAAPFRRALAYLSLKRNPKALADIEAALQLLGRNPSPLLVMFKANILNRMEKYERALRAAEQGMRIGPEAPRLKAQLLFQRAWAFGGLDQREQSLKILAEAARQDSKYIPYYQEAKALPPGGNLIDLFGNEELAEAWRAYLQSTRPADSSFSRKSGPRGPLFATTAAFLGGIVFAVAAALMIPRWRHRLRKKRRRLRRPR